MGTITVYDQDWVEQEVVTDVSDPEAWWESREDKEDILYVWEE